MWDETKAVLRGKFVAVDTFNLRVQTRKLIFHLKGLEKEQIKPGVKRGRKKDGIDIK